VWASGIRRVSGGIVEGHVSPLKMLKRQIFGRAQWCWEP
jgi:transposase